MPTELLVRGSNYTYKDGEGQKELVLYNWILKSFSLANNVGLMKHLKCLTDDCKLLFHTLKKYGCVD